MRPILPCALTGPSSQSSDTLVPLLGILSWDIGSSIYPGSWLYKAHKADAIKVLQIVMSLLYFRIARSNRKWLFCKLPFSERIYLILALDSIIII